ncbi:MAG: NAD(P)-dependent oxidoreductase [Armatimonadota bacterium]|nr:NAD(P)-dependent oxidoreductase [bacterium]
MKHDVEIRNKVSGDSIHHCGRIVLFGGSGFVGSNLRKWLGSELVVPSENEADLTNYQSLCSVIQPSDIIINAAGYANATDTTERGRLLLQAVNVDGVEKLARAAVQQSAAQLIHISSVAAMGRQRRENVTEDMMLPVASPYAASKLAGEQALLSFADKLPITVLRPTSVFGEGRGLARMLCKVASKRIVLLPGGGTARIPFTYIGNIARCVELCINNETCFGRTFIVGDEGSYALRKIVTGLAAAIGARAQVVPVPTTLAWCGVKLLETAAKVRNRPPLLDSGRLETLSTSVSYSISAFQTATGYAPPYSMPDALELIANWYLNESK